MAKYADVLERLGNGADIDPSRVLSPAGKSILRTSCQTISSHVIRTTPHEDLPDVAESTMPLSRNLRD